MSDAGSAARRTKIAGTLAMAAGCLSIVAWAVADGSPVRVAMGAVLLIVGMYLWRRGIRNGG